MHDLFWVNTMPFGFSVGDFITAADITWKICRAVKDASEDFFFWQLRFRYALSISFDGTLH